MPTHSKQLALHEHALEIYFIPHAWPSHLSSLFQMARLFGSAGQHVTIITTPANAKLLQESLNNDPKPGDHRVGFHVIPFPAAASGLPSGIERFSDIKDDETSGKLHYAFSVLLPPVMEAFIEQNPPDCIISDMFHPWTSKLAARIGRPRFIFHSGNVFANCVCEAMRLPDAPFRSLDSDHEPFVLSGLPHPIILSRSQVQNRFVKPGKITELFEHIRDSELESYGVVVNGWSEIDGEEFTEHYQKNMGHEKIYHVGPLSLIYSKAEEKGHECWNWLKGKSPNSVVYICFGSSANLPDDQLIEIARGIKASGCNFIWVVHRKVDDDGKQNHWLPEGFEEEMKENGKGIILRGWAPQVMILDSFATGAFVTHCGWNSIMEGVIAGVPLITWPMFAEQFYNEKLVTQVHKIGVEVGALEHVEYGPINTESLVKGECLERAIRKVMHGGAEAAGIRQRVKELGEVGKRAFEESGSSMKNLNAMIQELKELRSQ